MVYGLCTFVNSYMHMYYLHWHYSNRQAMSMRTAYRPIEPPEFQTSDRNAPHAVTCFRVCNRPVCAPPARVACIILDGENLDVERATYKTSVLVKSIFVIRHTPHQ